MMINTFIVREIRLEIAQRILVNPRSMILRNPRIEIRQTGLTQSVPSLPTGKNPTLPTPFMRWIRMDSGGRRARGPAK